MKLSFRTLIASALVCCALVVGAPRVRAVEGETARAADEANLRVIIQDYFAAYAARDATKLLTFWSEKAPEREARRAEVERQFAAVRSFELKALSVGSLSVEGVTARARVRVELSGADAKTGAAAAGVGAQERALAFVKEAAAWKVWRDAGAEDELASALLAAKDERARAALLASEPSLKAADLLQPAVKIANRLFVESEYERALAAYGLVRDLSTLAGNRRGLAQALLGEGLVHNARDESDLALASYAESMAAAESAKDASTVARALNNIGNVHYKRGDFTAALDSYRRSLEVQQAAGNDQSVAQALNNIGSVHYEQRDYPQARDYFERSLRLAEKAGDTRGAANTLNNLGDVAREAGDYPEALDYYGRALSASESINFKLGVARTLNNIGGGVYLYQSQARQALEYLNRSLTLYESIGEKYGLSIATYNTGRAHYFLGEREQALEYAARAVALGRESGNLKAVAQAQTLTGDVLAAAADRGAEARRAYEDAITTVEQMRAEAVGGEAQRQRFFENKTAPYEALVRLLAARGETAEAFASAERAKARVLLDVLRGGRGDVTKSMSERERADEVRLRGEVTRLNQQVAREGAQTRPDAARLAALKTQLGQARLAYEAFRTALYAAHPALRGQRGEARPLDAAGAAALLPDAHSAALEYAVTDEATYLFVLTRDGGGKPSLKVYTIPVKRADLYERAEAFRQLLAGRGLGFREAASRLYDLLLKPAARDLEGKTSLVVVPDTGLWNLPFQALVNGSGRYVVEEFAVSYASSLSVLGATRELRRGPAGARQLLAFGNPSNVPSVGVGETSADGSLPEAEREVKTLGRLYGGPRSKVFSGGEATEARVKAEAPRSSVIHLASHGVLDAANPLYSHVVLAAGGGEDGMLEAWELMQMDLHADLFVLSACETARGRVGAGEGVIGMSWALFIAGVPTVVVSNWQVSSASTTELMLDFHRQLTAPRARGRAADGKAEALRQASLALLKSPAYRHPFYWAGFSLIGDGR